MDVDKLFLLKPDFQDGGDQRYYCPHCTQLEGVLSFYPRLRKAIEVEYVDFARPRSAIVELLGEGNQDAPVLVVGDCFSLSANIEHCSANGHLFIAGEENIELRADTPNEFRPVTVRGKHPTQIKQIARLHRFHIGAERLRRRRKLDVKFLQPLLGASRPRAFAGYHLPTCAPPSTCSTSPVT